MGMEIQVYAEQVFLDNLLIDFTILWCIKRILHKNNKFKRIFIASLIGAAASLIMPLYIIFNSMIFKILSGFIIIFVAFWEKNFKIFLKTFLCFLLLTFITAGVAIVTLLFFSGDFYITPITFYTTNTVLHTTLIASNVMILLGIEFPRWISRWKVKLCSSVKVKIKTQMGLKELDAIIDTGNSLFDPVTKLPVAIANYEDIKDLLSNELNLALNGLYNQCTEMIYMIPYRCIGQENGVLFGFKPIDLIVQKQSVSNSYECIIAVAKPEFKKSQTHFVLLHPIML